LLKNSNFEKFIFILKFRIKRTIGSGMSKNVMLAKWKGSTIIYSVPNPKYPDRIPDFRHNLKMLQGNFVKKALVHLLKTFYIC